MNLATTIEIYAYGTSTGVEKAWDTRGRGRKQEQKTGVPISMVGYHATNDGNIKWGAGGAFFSPEPTPEYGEKLVRSRITFNNPLVVGDQVDAGNNLLDKAGAAKIEKLVTEDLPMGTIDYDKGWAQVDKAVADGARAKGYDGIIYTAPDSLSRQEFVVLNHESLSGTRSGGTSQAYSEKLLRQMSKQ